MYLLLILALLLPLPALAQTDYPASCRALSPITKQKVDDCLNNRDRGVYITATQYTMKFMGECGGYVEETCPAAKAEWERLADDNSVIPPQVLFVALVDKYCGMP